MIITVTLNPALDKTAQVPRLALDTVNRITTLRTDPGGKGINVSKTIAAFGGDSIAMGLLGGGSGRAILTALEEMGLDCRFVTIPGETRTNLKLIDPVQHTHTDINEPGAPVSREHLTKLLEQLCNTIQPGDLVVLSGSLPVGAPIDTYRTWIEVCHQAGAQVFLDADGVALQEGWKGGPWLIKPNSDELSHLVGRPLTTLAHIAQAAEQLLSARTRHVVVSLGSQGALFVEEGWRLLADPLPVDVKSTVGAGDSMVAALALAHQKHLSPEETIRMSMAAGAAAVTCSGTQAASWEDVQRLMPMVHFRPL